MTPRTQPANKVADALKEAHDPHFQCADGCHEWADKRKSLPRLRRLLKVDPDQLAEALWPVMADLDGTPGPPHVSGSYWRDRAVAVLERLSR